MGSFRCNNWRKGRLCSFINYKLFFQDPLYIFQIWKGGMSFHGGLIGMILAIYLFAKQNNLSFFYLSDLVSIVAPIGLFLGRISNFINTELYGRITDFPFAFIYPLIDNNPRHPSQLYEAFFEGVVLFIILYLYFYKKFKKILCWNYKCLFSNFVFNF